MLLWISKTGYFYNKILRINKFVIKFIKKKLQIVKGHANKSVFKALALTERFATMCIF